VTAPIGSFDDYGKSIAIQRDGKIVVAGDSKVSFGVHDFAVVRYNPDGSLDSTFNGTGKVQTGIGSGSNDEGHSIAIQDDGKIIVAGMTSSMNNADFAVVRYNPNGSLDTTFRGTGKAMVDFGAMEAAYALALQADGRIVVVGISGGERGPPLAIRQDIAVARLNVDGNMDTAFMGGGFVTTPIGASDDRAFGVAIQTDGKIIVAGDSHNAAPVSPEPTYKIAIVRYHSGPLTSAAWRRTFFGATDNGAGADLNDPDGDGLPNLLEFATGNNPVISSPAVA